MYKYEMIEYHAGATVEVVRYIPRRFRKESAALRIKKTREEIRKGNMIQAARKLTRKINANFKPGDLHVVLTYRRERSPGREQAQKNIESLLGRLRRQYRKAGKILKYILVTEYKSTSIHHHMIVNNINDGKETTQDYIRKAWREQGISHYTPLYDNADYQALAEYLIKETERTFRDPDSPVKQRYSCSRNLVDPKERHRTVRAKRPWAQDPTPRQGYYIDKDSLYNGWDRLGFPYQRYTMIKLVPAEDDWPPDDWVPPARKTDRKKKGGG